MDPTIQDGKYVLTPNSDPKNFVAVEVGDTKQPDFHPQVKIMRWDNETNFSARLIHNESAPTVTLDGDTVKWQGEKTEAHFYHMDAADYPEHPEGAHEFEVHLLEKPDTNLVQFTIRDKNLAYYYQPAPAARALGEIMICRISTDVKAFNPTSILDVGGYDGSFATIMSGVGVETTSIDISTGTDVTQGIPATDKQYDLVTSFGMLCFVPDDKIDFVISEIARVSNRALITANIAITNSPSDFINNDHDDAWWADRFATVAPDFPITIATFTQNNVPENVEGSYAVYYSIPKINTDRSKIYKTGKVGHIFRPSITDASGKTVWGTLNISEGILTIEVPQEFLDTATYPVVVDPTFGYTTAGSSFLSNQNNIITGSVFTGAAGTATTMSSYGGYVGLSSLKVQLGIYTISGTSASFVEGSVTNTAAVSTAWMTVNLNASTTVSAVTYYLAMWGLASGHITTMSFYYDAGSSGTSMSVADTYADQAWPSTLSLTSGSNIFSIYVTYTGASSGSLPPPLIIQQATARSNSY